MKTIIFGIGDFAKQLHYYLTSENRFEVEYFCVNKKHYNNSEFLGKKVLIFEEDLKDIPISEYKFIIGVGYNNLRARKLIFNSIKDKGYKLINFIHPTVLVYGEVLGEGNIILSDVILEPFSKVDNNNIIWSKSLICHDSKIGNHNFIAAGSVIGGFSEVLENNFLGFNVTIKDNVSINNEVLIGANSLVLNSPEDYGHYHGTPAKKIKSHRKDGIRVN